MDEMLWQSENTFFSDWEEEKKRNGMNVELWKEKRILMKEGAYIKRRRKRWTVEKGNGRMIKRTRMKKW